MCGDSSYWSASHANRASFNPLFRVLSCFSWTRVVFALAALTFAAWGGAARAQGGPPYYEEDVAASNPLRAEQARELDAYINAQKADSARLKALFTPDYRSPKAFEASARRLRQAFAASIGYPPPGAPDSEPPEFKQIGDDGIGTYYRVRISVLPGVHAEGIYIVPKGLKGRAPLIVAMHGGGGSPEVALFHGGANYHDMVRGGAKRGYVVFAPQHLFSAPGYPADVRNRTDDRMRLIGTSLTAVEIAKITRSLDVLLKRPEIDPKRVAMVGLSYGGYYALVTPALDTRIRCAVSSCYFGVQEYRYERNELGVPSDFRFADRFTLLRDPEIVALICPRALEIQAGSRDDAEHRDMGVQLAPKAAEYYRALGRGDDFRFVLFQGGHEFDDASAWEFVEKHL
ncbi:MAG TPA: dienelactone hydrolase family protein [Chthonomonadaceae bacterium]|nr:dienelactone hydrolase family protein [Chthonomonadaceae bacterium]